MRVLPLPTGARDTSAGTGGLGTLGVQFLFSHLWVRTWWAASSGQPEGSLATGTLSEGPSTHAGSPRPGLEPGLWPWVSLSAEGPERTAQEAQSARPRPPRSWQG